MQQINHPVVGFVTLKKHKRSRRISIRVKPQKGIIVTLPYRTPYEHGISFLEQSISWIQEQQKKVAVVEAKQLILPGKSYPIRNKQIRIVGADSTKMTLDKSPSDYIITIPNSLNIHTSSTQERLRFAVVEILRLEAKRYLPERTKELAAQQKIHFKKVFIKNVSSRWGSCSAVNNINLSLYLMLLPDELIDYVIWHELAHVHHKNHSDAFWKHLEDLLPGANLLDKQLRHYKHPF